MMVSFDTRPAVTARLSHRWTMTMIPPEVLPKIAKMLPRLASDSDGEIVACAKAVGRALAGAGADWHDLVSAVEIGSAIVVSQPKAERHTPNEHPPKWRRLSPDDREGWLRLILEECDPSPWEEDFIISVLLKHRRVAMSDKQCAILDRLIADAWRAE